MSYMINQVIQPSGVHVNITVNPATPAIQTTISNYLPAENAIVSIVLGTIKLHGMGKTCKGSYGNAKQYIHIPKTSNELLAFSNVTSNPPNYTITIDALGTVKSGKKQDTHTFKTNGNF